MFIRKHSSTVRVFGFVHNLSTLPKSDWVTQFSKLPEFPEYDSGK